MSVHVECRTCTHVEELPISDEQIARWRGGELIQNVMPELSADQRELLISGTCGTCWEALFPPEE